MKQLIKISLILSLHLGFMQISISSLPQNILINLTTKHPNDIIQKLWKIKNKKNNSQDKIIHQSIE